MIILIHLNALSYIKDIPISYILKNGDLDWQYNIIAERNITFQEKDIQNNKFNQRLYNNDSIPLDWLIKRQDFKHRVKSLSPRLKTKEIDFLYQHGYALNWRVISSCNKHITKYHILNHPEYPWDYTNLHIYINSELTPNFYRFDSEDLDYNDLEEFGLFSGNNKQSISFLFYNRNLTFEDLKTIGFKIGFHTNPLDRPKLQKYYRNIFSQIIIELLY